MNQITEFQVVDHGIDGAQYFPGCGVSYTNFAHVVTGCGDDFAEALDDALESVAQSEETDGVDFAAFEKAIASEGFGTVDGDTVTWQESDSASKVMRIAHADGETDDELSELDVSDMDTYYYVSIRYNVAKKEQ